MGILPTKAVCPPEKKRRTKNNEKMNVRDYITAAIMYVLMFLVYAGVGAPIGMTVAGSLFVFAACAVVVGNNIHSFIYKSK